MANPHLLSPLEGGKFKPFLKTNIELFCSNLGDLVYTCMLCASRSNDRLITGIRTHVFWKTTYHVSKGRSFDRASGGAHFMTFPSRTQVLEPRQLWWWRTRGLRHESGFPKFSKNKIFRWRLCNLAKQSMFGTFSFKIDFSKRFVGFRLTGVYQSHIALCKIRFRTVTGVRTVVARTQICAVSEKGGTRRMFGRSTTRYAN